MLAIFEGNEDSGKTSLINAIKEVRPWFMITKRTSFKTYWDDLEDGATKYPECWDLATSFKFDWRFFLESIGQDGFKVATFLADRSFITHMIFAKALYPETWNALMDKYYEAYEFEVRKLDHVVFYCKRDVENFSDYFSGSHTLNQVDYDKLQAEYETWRDSTKLNVVDIDNQKHTIKENLLTALLHVGA